VPHAGNNRPTLIPDKPYFKIGEVAQLAGVEPYVLRYWESEFRMIRPEKTRTNQRMYRRRDVEAVLQIKKLLYDEGYRIDGAKRRLRELSGEETAVQVKALAGGLRSLISELEKIVDDDEGS
jgi:DNA-binding transcriptional MerR regulator